MAKRKQPKLFHVTDATLFERVVWDAEIDGEYFCYVTKLSTDPESNLYSLNIDSIYTAEKVQRRLFTHEGKVTVDLINSWKQEIEDTVDRITLNNWCR